MRFFRILATAASLLATFTGAQNNPLAITSPIGGNLQAGTQVTIKWTPTTASTVTLQLRYGSNSGNLAIGSAITESAPNTGSFTWTVPSGLANTAYAIQITDSSGVTNYSPPFQVSGGTGNISTASTSKASTTESPTSTSTSATSKSTSSSASSSSSASKSTSSSPSSTSSAAAQSSTATKAPNTGDAGKLSGGSFVGLLGFGAFALML